MSEETELLTRIAEVEDKLKNVYHLFLTDAAGAKHPATQEAIDKLQRMFRIYFGFMQKVLDFIEETENELEVVHVPNRANGLED